MLKKIHRHMQKHLGKKEDKNVLLLRLLLITMVVAIAYMIIMPSKKERSNNTEKIMLNTKEITLNSTFRMATTHLCAAVLEAKLTDVEDTAIELTFLSKQDATRKFVPLNPPESHRVQNGDCIPAHAACDGTAFEYCFSVDTRNMPVAVNYEVREK